MPRRILFLYKYCNLGGVTSVLKQRKRVFDELGWEMCALFERDYGGLSDLARFHIEAGIHAEKYEQWVVRAARSGRFDGFVIFDNPELIRRVRAASKAPIIYEIHTSYDQNILKNAAADLALCDLILTPSGWLKSVLQGYFPGLDEERLTVQANIVDDEVFQPAGERLQLDSPTLLWVGKQSTGKNFAEGLAFAAAFLQKHPGWQFVSVTGGLIDEGEMKDALAEVEEHGLAQRFTWLHNLSQRAMGRLYRGAAGSGGFLLSTSQAESFCLVVHEAMRCGLPVLSTRLGAVAELVQDGENGLTYPPGDLEAALARAEMLLDAQVRQKMIEQGYVSLQRYDPAELRRQYAALLQKVFGGCPPPGLPLNGGGEDLS